MSEAGLEHDVEAALRRRLAPPPPEAMRRMAERALRDSEAGAAPAVPRRRWRAGIGLAAAVGAMLLGAWFAWQSGILGPLAPYRTPPRMTLAQVYHAEVAAGLKPKWPCDDEQEFADTIGGRFGQPLVLTSLPADVEALGLCYAHTLSPATLHVLARRGESPIVVFVDRLERDRPAEAGSPGDGRLKVHRGTVGGLVLYEVSPLDAPVLLDHFKVGPGGCPEGS